MHRRLKPLLLLIALSAFLAVACSIPFTVPQETSNPTAPPTDTPVPPLPPTKTPLPATCSPTPPASHTALPDLEVYYHFVIYHGCAWGGTGEAAVHVTNNGEADAGPFRVIINSGSTTIEGLPAGEGVDARVEFAEGPIGGISARIDPDDQVLESDETNNSFEIMFTPPPPCEETPAP